MVLSHLANISGKVAKRRQRKVFIMRSDRKATPSQGLSGKELLNNSKNRFIHV